MFNKILSAIGKFAYRFRYAILASALVLLVGVSYMQSKALISYSYFDYNKVTDIFPEEDTLVIVYNNADEDKISSLADELSENKHITSIQAYANTLGLEMSASELAVVAEIDESFINTLFYMYENGTATEGMSLLTFTNYIASDSFLNNELFASMIDDDTKAQLLQSQSLLNGVAQNTEYDATTLAYILGMDVQTVQGIFAMNATETMTLDGFIDVMLQMAAAQGENADQAQIAQLQGMKQLCVLVKSNQALSPDQLITAFPVQSEAFTEDTVSLLYLMYYGNTADLSNTKIALYDFFGFLTDDVLTNEQFSAFFDESSLAELNEAKATMEDGKAQLVGKDYSRMILTVDYELESKEINEFYDNLSTKLNGVFEKDYYMVGNSAMSYELSQTFQTEYLLISIITAIAIFIVVCVTFRKFSIPLMLVCIIECAVFTTMSIMAISNNSMYFIALIIVQCILMGSMIDYGILMTSYYQEVRKEYDVEHALPEVLKRSINAILTSALIMVAITFICGAFMKGAVSSILTTLGIGTLSAIILVIFVLPSLLAIFDKAVIRSKKKTQEI